MFSLLKTHIALITGKLRIAAYDSGNANELLNSAIVLKWLGINRATLHRWVNGRHDADRNYGPLTGFPPPITIHGRNYWRRNDILKFLNDRTNAA